MEHVEQSHFLKSTTPPFLQILYIDL